MKPINTYNAGQQTHCSYKTVGLYGSPLRRNPFTDAGSTGFENRKHTFAITILSTLISQASSHLHWWSYLLLVWL